MNCTEKSCFEQRTKILDCEALAFFKNKVYIQKVNSDKYNSSMTFHKHNQHLGPGMEHC